MDSINIKMMGGKCKEICSSIQIADGWGSFFLNHKKDEIYKKKDGKTNQGKLGGTDLI
jgi:hypothetical protein